MSNYRERWFNRSLDEWSHDLVLEASRDAVNTEQVYSALKNDFGMEEEESRLYFKKTLKNLINAGAKVVVYDNEGFWKDPDYHDLAGKEEYEYVVERSLTEECLYPLSGLWLKIS